MTDPKFPPKLYLSPCRMADVWNENATVDAATEYLQGDITYLSEIEHEALIKVAIAEALEMAAKYIEAAAKAARAAKEGT